MQSSLLPMAEKETQPHPACYVGATNGERADKDFYPTPVGATLALLQAEKFPGVIWEPACGDGAIGKAFESAGYAVIGTDLIYRGYGDGGYDFFRFREPPNGCHSLVTNPPYQQGNFAVEDWIAHSWAMPQIQKMAMFLKTTSLAGKDRIRILEASNFSKFYQFRQRVTCYANGVKVEGFTSMIDQAWYVFERGYTEPPRIYWIDEVKPADVFQPPLFAG